jgi:large subunit ribosomal protein L7/L12
MAETVFISFAPADSALAEEYAAFLSSRGIPYSLSSESHGPDTAAVMVLLFTDNTNGHPDTLRDFKVAVGRSIPIVGLRIAASFLSYEVDTLNAHVEWINSVISKPQDQFSKLTDQVAIHLRGTHVAAHTEAPVHHEPPPIEAEFEIPNPRPVPHPSRGTSIPDPHGSVGTEAESIAPPILAPPPAPVHYDVVLTSPGVNKIGLIKVIRIITNQDLATCKDVAESRMPVNLVRVSSHEEAMKILELIYSTGASGDVHPASDATMPVLAKRPPAQTGCSTSVFLTLVAVLFLSAAAFLLA